MISIISKKINKPNLVNNLLSEVIDLKVFSILTLIVKTGLRLLILLTIKDYRLYLVVDLVCNLLSNVCVSLYVKYICNQ